MSRKDRLTTWAQPPSKTEQDRIDRTEKLIKAALSDSPDFRVTQAKVFAKGSVKSRTNIRNGSDIDICVQPQGVFFSTYPTGYEREDYGHHGVDYTFMTFRKDVLNALQSAFQQDVTEGNKSIKIRANVSGTRIDADVVPAFEFRQYNHPPYSVQYDGGIAFCAKGNSEKLIHNWPHHNHDNTLEKQRITSKRYRKAVRITKWMKHFMLENGSDSAKHAPSFLIESLMWNVPNHLFGGGDIEEDMKMVLAYLREKVIVQSEVVAWKEVNNMKQLFSESQKWTLPQAQAFVFEVNDYFGQVR